MPHKLRLVAAAAITLALIPLTALAIDLPTASADSAPPAGTPATVTDDELPTVQINGVVWAQVTVGNTVYATGSFTSARPAGSPLGTNEIPRANLLAYDIRTGDLITSFNHTLNAQGNAITASPDGSRIYVGGQFTTVDGVAHHRLVAISTATGSVISTFTGGVGGATSNSNAIKTITATNTDVYVGGSFQNSSTNVARTNLAEFTSAGALTTWAPKTSGGGNIVLSSILTPDKTKVLVGGNFSAINGATFHAMAALNPTTGAVLPWGSSSATYPIRQDGSGTGAAVSSLTTDGTYIFMTMWNAVHGTVNSGLSEGRAAVSPANGAIVWINDCHGDTYDAFPINGVLYSVGHAHGCENIGAFPETTPRTWHHSLAESIKPSGGKNAGPSNNYPTFAGLPDTTQLDWYPDLTDGTYTGMSQAAWSVTGNTQYIALGGEFPKVNGVAQQGLVRFAVAAIAPNKVGPKGYTTSFPVSATTANAAGTSTISFPTTWDPDNASLTYSLYRDNSATPAYTTTVNSRFWSLPAVTFNDTGLSPGSLHFYQLYVKDSFGNQVGPYFNMVDDQSSAITYSGAWTSQTGVTTFNDYGNSRHYTTVNGASATLHFTGPVVSVVAEDFTNYGKLSISVDGGAATIVSTTLPAGSAREVPQRVYTLKGLATGPHAITVTKVDNTYAVLDGFLVTGFADSTAPTGGSIVPVNDNTAGITYTGKWTYSTKRGFGDLGDDIHYSIAAGTSASYTFKGTGIDVLMPGYTNYGDAQVLIDGKLAGTTDEHTASRVGQKITFSDRGLAAGTHTVQIKFVSGTYVCIDGFNIYS